MWLKDYIHLFPYIYIYIYRSSREMFVNKFCLVSLEVALLLEPTFSSKMNNSLLICARTQTADRAKASREVIG